MKRVTGLGGIFFKARDHKKLREWYGEHLGLPLEEDGSASFHWRDIEDPDQMGFSVWSAFPQNTDYFDPSTAPFMVNFRVADLDALLEQLRLEGVEVDDRREEYEFGKFGWIIDPEGNRIELWEPR